MHYRECSPPVSLEPWVECIWALDEHFPGDPAGQPQRITPDGCAEWIMHFGGGCRRLDRGGEEEPRAFLIGPIRRFIQLLPLGRTEIIAVRFRPGGLAGFTRLPAFELTDQTVAPEEVFGPSAKLLFQRLTDEPPRERFGQAVRLISDYLPPIVDGPGRVLPIVRMLLNDRGTNPTGATMGATGLSLRQVQRLFRAEVGLTPKRLARIMRFQNLLAMRTSQLSWVDVAAERGFSDQSHMVHEFRDLAGVTPKQFLEEQGRMNEVFASPERMSRSYNTSRES